MSDKLIIDLGNGFGLQIPKGINFEDIKFIDIEYVQKSGICDHHNQMKFFGPMAKAEGRASL